MNDERVFDESVELTDNAMLRRRPELFYEWDFEKNDELGLDVYRATVGSGKKVWWICPKGHKYDSVIYSRAGAANTGCPYCAGKRVCEENALSTTHPHLMLEWDWKKNSILPSEITFGSQTKAWWTCPDCNSSYDALIGNRARLGTGCTYCSGQSINHTNSLATINPELASEWHPTRNGELTPHDVAPNTSKLSVWWLGECGHEWDAVISDRGGGRQGCPYCSGHRVLKGFNDLWTTNPSIAKWLKTPEVGYEYSRGSNTRTDWICPQCKSVIRNKMITTVNRQGLGCQGCSDGLSFGERFVFHALKSSGINFEVEKSFKWSQNKRYDFYLPDYNWIVEVHGIQHYEKSPFHEKGQTLEVIQGNDRWKREVANENGIKEYVVIDARVSEALFVANSIKNTKLGGILGLVDFEDIGKKSYSSFLIAACDLWNGGLRSTLEISKELGVYRYTATQYLKRGAKIGLCDYDPIVESQNSWTHRQKKVGKRLVQLDTDGNILKEWESIAEAKREMRISRRTINECCRGLRESAGGYVWRYAQDYYKEED